MAFSRPTLREIADRIKSDLDVSLGGAGARLRRSFEFAVAKAVAGAVHLLHGHMDWTARQIFASTADEEMLVRKGSAIGIVRKEPTVATGSVLFTGEAGSVIDAGTELENEDGWAYTTDDAVTIPSSPPLQILADVTATVEGAAGNVEAGGILTLTSPVAGVNSEAAVQSPGLENGTDLEDLELYRERVQERERRTPQGGAAGDYVEWAKEVSFVTRAWERWGGPGAVYVYFTTDDDESGIIPSGDQVDEVQEYLQVRDEDNNVTDGVAPVHAIVSVAAPTAAPQDFEIELTSYSSALEEAIEAELEDLFFDVAEPGGTITISQIRDAIARATTQGYALISPTVDIEVEAGELPTVGDVDVTEA